MNVSMLAAVYKPKVAGGSDSLMSAGGEKIR